MAARSEPEYHYSLTCPCGTPLSGDSEDEIVEAGFAHLRESHPDLADTYERNHILAMAVRLRKLEPGWLFGAD